MTVGPAVGSVSSETFDPEAWAERVSSDLLAAQIRNRTLPPTERAGKTEEFLRERLAELADSVRPVALASLAARFPLRDPPPQASTAKPSWIEWVAALDEVNGPIPEEVKKTLVEKLTQAGILNAASEPRLWTTPGLAALAKDLPADQDRAALLVDLLLETIRSLDTNFRNVWVSLADFGKTDAGLPRESLSDVFRRFLAGDPDVPKVVLKARLEATTKLIPHLIIALKESWDDMIRQTAPCLPEEVQSRVKKGSFNLPNAFEANCWREYTAAAKALQRETMELRFFATLVERSLKSIK